MSKKQIGDIIQIFEDAAKSFEQLHKEASLALPDQDAYNKKLFEKAELLVQLPLRLPSEVEGIEEEVWKTTLKWIEYFARRAIEALGSRETFALGALLIHPGQMDIEDNDLQKLIGELKTSQNN